MLRARHYIKGLNMHLKWLQIRTEANQRRDLLKRQSANRIKQWLDKLSEPVSFLSPWWGHITNAQKNSD